MTVAMQLEEKPTRQAVVTNIFFGKFRVFEICAGYGSQAMALKNLGLDIHADIAEIDDYAIQAYNQLHGETHNWGDVYKIDETKLPSYDLITYSTPCQDFSVAGKQQGGDKGSGTRSSLLWECERIIKAVKPKYLLMENVKNLVGKKHKHNFIAWLKTLEQLGYNNYWQVLNAKDYGIPQNRERVFVVSIRKDLNKTYIFPQKQELKIRLKDILESNVDEKYYLSNEKVEKFLHQLSDKIDSQDVSYCIDANYFKGTTPKQFLEKSRRQLVKDVSVMHVGNITGRKSHGGYAGDIFNPEGLSPTLNTMQGGNRMPFITEPTCAAVRGRGDNNTQSLEVNKSGCTNTLTSVQKDNYVVEPKIIQVGNIVQTESFGGNPQCGRIYSSDGISPTINTMQGGQREPKIIEPLKIKEATIKGYAEAYPYDSVTLDMPNSKTRRGQVGKQVSNTLLCSCNVGVVEPKIITNYRIRKLTPRECWRLMGVKDEQFDKLHDISNSQLYKMAGNSIVVDVLEHIFRNLLFAETTKQTEQKGQLSLL